MGKKEKQRWDIEDLVDHLPTLMENHQAEVVSKLDKKTLVALIERAEAAYRDGRPLVCSDTIFDTATSVLKKMAPKHPLLNKIGKEKWDGKKRVRHPESMLSTDKSWSIEDTRLWVASIRKKAEGEGIDPDGIEVRVTAKLDGLAAMLREDGRLVTRGDGTYGYDISIAFERGVIDKGNGTPGVGEVVMDQEYFDGHLTDSYSHPRGVCVGVVKAETLNDDFKPMLDAGAVHFTPYTTLEPWEGSFDGLLGRHDEIQEEIRSSTPYPIDGVVAEITHEKLKQSLGSTSHHYRWQIAIKQPPEPEEATVVSITWQTGKTGRLTPVLNVEPIELSGATVSNITAHHAMQVKEHRLGKGAVIQAVRSGEVIPKIVGVVKPAKKTTIPRKCPSCGHDLKWESDFITCTNHETCPAQNARRLEYFFKTHGQVDGFGPKSIEKLMEAGIGTLEKIYGSTESDFEKAGFGKGQAKNLRRELDRSQEVPIEDWRFLAAFGIARLGGGNARSLLQHLRLRDLEQVAEEEIASIEGFAESSAADIVTGLKERWPTIEHLLELGFNLEKTPMMSETANIVSPIAGKKIVFTGKMNQGSRDQMQKEATQLGAQVQGSVSAKTDLLVCGENVGASKKGKAKKFGVEMIGEDDYIALLKKGTNKPVKPKTAKKSKTKIKVTKKVAKKVTKKPSSKKKAAKKTIKKSSSSAKLEGQTFVVTGTLSSFSRAEAKASIEALGGKVSGSVSGKTDCVVIGVDPGSKAEKAKALGIKIIKEAAFKRSISS